MDLNMSSICVNNKYSLNSEMKQPTSQATFQAFSGYVWLVPPLKYGPFLSLQEVLWDRAVPSHPWTSRGWALSWEQYELGGSGAGTPGPGGGGVCPELTGVDSSVPRPRPG